MYTLNRDICFDRSRAMQKTINGVLMAYWGKKGLNLVYSSLEDARSDVFKWNRKYVFFTYGEN